MRHGLTIFLYSIGVLQLIAAATQQQLHHGTITPKLTMVAMVDGKAFFVDRDNSTWKNRTQAVTYCVSLGMRLAEITSPLQFLALDQAVIDEWVNGSCAWTGGVETRTIQRYAWESNDVALDPSYIPYRKNLVEDSEYFLIFWKYVNASHITNSLATAMCTAVLCESRLSEKQNDTALS